MKRITLSTILSMLVLLSVFTGCASPAAPVVTTPESPVPTAAAAATEIPLPTLTQTPAPTAAASPTAEPPPTEASPASGSIVIGYANSSQDQPPEKEKELLQACDELQIQCLKGASIPELVEQNVSAVIVFSNRWHVMGAYPQIHEAASAGIPVIVLDAETSEPGVYNLSVESETVRASLKWMFKQMGDTGEFVYYNFGHSDFHQALIEEVLKDFPGIQATAMPAEFNGSSLTEESIAALVAENPDLGAIWTDEEHPNLFWGLKDVQGKHIPLAVCAPRMDIMQPWLEQIEAGSPFKCITFIKPGGTAYEGVYVAYYLLSGEQVDPAALGGDAGNTFIYQYPEITNDNLAEWLGKVDSLRVGSWNTLELPPMTPAEILEKWFLD